LAQISYQYKPSLNEDLLCFVIVHSTDGCVSTSRIVNFCLRLSPNNPNPFRIRVMLFSINHSLKTLQCNPHKAEGKGTAIPLQAWTGPEVSRRLRLPDFKTIGT